MNSTKNKIVRVWVESKIDDSPDTSYIGEYTKSRDTWNIDRETGEYVAKEMQLSRIIEALENRIDCPADYPVAVKTVDNNSSAENAELVAWLNHQNTRLQSLKAIDLHQHPTGHGEYRYFKPYAGGKTEGTTDYRKYGKQDFENMESLNNGNWWYVGIMANAEIVTTSGTRQVIRSGGLWGIEDHCNKDSRSYINEEAKNQLAYLSTELASLGFSQQAINRAIKQWDGEIKDA